MLTKNVQFAERPEDVMVHRIGTSYTCRVDFPVNIRETEVDDDVQYIADVYSTEVGYTEGLKERIEQNIEPWMELAKVAPAPQPTIQDAIDAINELTEIILGGE